MGMHIFCTNLHQVMPTGSCVTGMAGVLSLLKERGELNKSVEWAGRTNDMKPVALQGLDDVYKSGAHKEELANR